MIMKTILLILSTIILTTVSTFAQDGKDWIVLSDGDTLYGNIWGVQPNLLRFEAKGNDKTSLVALEMVQSYFRKGEIVVVNGVSKVPTELEIVAKYPEENKLHIAGLKLQKSADLFYSGTAVTVLGGITTIIGSIISRENPNTGEIVAYVGVGVTTLGTVIGASAFIPISEAGLQLKSIKLGK